MGHLKLPKLYQGTTMRPDHDKLLRILGRYTATANCTFGVSEKPSSPSNYHFKVTNIRSYLGLNPKFLCPK